MASGSPTNIEDHLQGENLGDDSTYNSKPTTQNLKYRPRNERKKKDKNHNTNKLAMNPLQQGIRQFLDDYHHRYSLDGKGGPSSNPPTNNGDDNDISAIQNTAELTGLPKRYTIYQPMLLLPANVFTSPPAWAALYAALSDADRQQLYASIATSFRSMGVTHIAMNAPILLTDSQGVENRMRSPTGLVPLYGDFGGRLLDPNQIPDEKDFEETFWVQTVQNGGVVQSWAPLYTMFSRGNITEKARILGLEGHFTGLDEASLKGRRINETSVVDLYAGIGYFVFSYLRRGVKRVWGWELNAWSVEGLRRGCLANGWKCKVVPLHPEGEGGISSPAENNNIECLLNELGDDDRVVIFQGDNQTAPAIMEKVQLGLEQRGLWAPVRHVNLGLLPTSRPTWETSLKLLDRKYGGWAHVHENVDIAEIENKKKDIVTKYTELASQLDGDERNNLLISCDHVERVKTYAPGVMHCVYDIQINFEEG